MSLRGQLRAFMIPAEAKELPTDLKAYTDWLQQFLRLSSNT